MVRFGISDFSKGFTTTPLSPKSTTVTGWPVSSPSAAPWSRSSWGSPESPSWASWPLTSLGVSGRVTMMISRTLQLLIQIYLSWKGKLRWSFLDTSTHKFTGLSQLVRLDCNGIFKFALLLKWFRLSTNDLVSSTFVSVTIKLNMFWSSVPSAAVGRRPKEMVRNSRATLGQCVLKIWSSVCLLTRTKQKTKIFNFIASKCYHIHHHLIQN